MFFAQYCSHTGLRWLWEPNWPKYIKIRIHVQQLPSLYVNRIYENNKHFFLPPSDDKPLIQTPQTLAPWLIRLSGLQFHILCRQWMLQPVGGTSRSLIHDVFQQQTSPQWPDPPQVNRPLPGLNLIWADVFGLMLRPLGGSIKVILSNLQHSSGCSLTTLIKQHLDDLFPSRLCCCCYRRPTAEVMNSSVWTELCPSHFPSI